jgi:hypothetical protein
MRLDTLCKLLKALETDFAGLGEWIDTLKQKEREETLPLWDLAEPTGLSDAVTLRRKLIKLGTHLEDVLRDVEGLIGDSSYVASPRSFNITDR